MSDFEDEAERFEVQLRQLEDTMSGATSMTAAFQNELRGMQDSMLYTNREVSSMSRSIGSGLRRAFDGLVFDGMQLSDALRTVATSVVDSAYNAAISPVQNALGGAIANGINGLFSGMSLFEKGGAFSGGRVTPFATGRCGARTNKFSHARWHGADGRGGDRRRSCR